jgi:hypothetical protein
MQDINPITEQVLKNCDISDSQNAGLYSICGLALRLRDLYKWEKRLEPWEEKDYAEVLEWIGEKEEKWEDLIEEEFVDLSILGRRYDPFDTKGINAVLEPRGFFYGAGYARSLKPIFFLGRIKEQKKVNGYNVYVLGRELARDLLTIPALSQDNSILLRKESAKLFLWDQISYLKKSGRPALRFALENCGIKDQQSEALKHSLEKIYAIQKETYIYHEIGEMQDTVFDRDIWREVIAAYPHTPVELLVRAVKDLLADTNANGTLRYIIRKRLTASLAFYVAFFDGLAKEIFPELSASFEVFARKRDWQMMEQTVFSGYNTARLLAENIIEIYNSGKQKNDKNWAENEIKEQLLNKLICRSEQR